jgi:hypothetical protein
MSTQNNQKFQKQDEKLVKIKNKVHAIKLN